MKKTRIAPILYMLIILIAGFANAAAKLITKEYNAGAEWHMIAPAFSTLLFCVNLLLYLFLIVFWMQSVRLRLLPSRARSYMIAASWCAVAMLVLRSAKYRLIGTEDLTVIRYTWYLYYVPMILLPTLFLMNCIRIEGKNRQRRFDERMLLIPAGVMIVLFLTNDLHYLAFRPNGDTVMTGANASYFNNILFYVYYIYFGAAIIAGMILLVRANRRHHSFGRVLLPFLYLSAILALVLTDKTLNWLRLPSMFTAPEIVSFGMIGIFESCVRNRLILYNENYSGFFAQMRFPAIITHADYTVAYRSAKALDASTDQLRKALNAPLYLDENTKLTGKPITAGYAFYTDDESELHHMNDRLTEANGLIASENDLIQAENELKARQAAVDARSLVYSRIDDRMLPYHRAALRLLDEMRPGTPEFQRQAARLNFLNAYIKRGTNLLLTNEGEESIPMKELGMAFDEASVYLQYCGVKAVVSVNDEGSISRDGALMLFTAFYEIAQRLLDSADIIQASVKDRRLRMIADCPEPPAMPEHVRMEQGDGLWYFSVTVGEGGAA